MADLTNTEVSASACLDSSKAIEMPQRSPEEAQGLEWSLHGGDEDFDACCFLDDELMAVADDTDDPQDVCEYAADIYGRLGRDEAFHRRPHPNYMKAQPDLDASARASSVDWLVGVQMKYKLKTETLFLAVSILDRFLATRRVRRRDLQLVACTAAFIAAKFEEIHPPEVRDFVFITNQACRKEAVLAMEVTMLTALEFCLCRPTAAHYLQRYQRERDCSEAQSLLQYLLELALLDLRMTRFSPSLQAAAAALVSSRLVNSSHAWPEIKGGLAEASENALQCCAHEMLQLLRDAREGTIHEVRRKFSRPEFHSIAVISESSLAVEAYLSDHEQRA